MFFPKLSMKERTKINTLKEHISQKGQKTDHHSVSMLYSTFGVFNTGTQVEHCTFETLRNRHNKCGSLSAFQSV